MEYAKNIRSQKIIKSISKGTINAGSLGVRTDSQSLRCDIAVRKILNAISGKWNIGGKARWLPFYIIGIIVVVIFNAVKRTRCSSCFFKTTSTPACASSASSIC
jgi:hypothetical protein